MITVLLVGRYRNGVNYKLLAKLTWTSICAESLLVYGACRDNHCSSSYPALYLLWMVCTSFRWSGPPLDQMHVGGCQKERQHSRAPSDLSTSGALGICCVLLSFIFLLGKRYILRNRQQLLYKRIQLIYFLSLSFVAYSPLEARNLISLLFGLSAHMISWSILFRISLFQLKHLYSN